MDLIKQFVGMTIQPNDGSQQQGDPASTAEYQPKTQSSGGPSVHLPPELLQVIDKYVDTFAPGISQGITSEIEAFENSTLGSLEQHVKDVILGVFHGNTEHYQSESNINEFTAAREGPNQAGGDGPNLPQYNYPDPSVVVSRGDSSSLPGYGTRGLPFAGSAVAVPPPDPQAPQKQKTIFNSALSAVKNFAEKEENKVQDGIENEMQIMASKINELAANIDTKVSEILPDLKAEVSKVLQDLHTGLAEKMAQAALACLKAFLAGAVKLEELGEEAVKGAEHLLEDFADGAAKEREDPSLGHGPVGLLSNKLSGGLTVVRGGARVDFRDMLSKIEESLFNSLPDCLKGPLSKIFGGDPFNPNAGADGTPSGQSGAGIFAEIGEKIKEIVERIQQALRDRVLEVVSGGHRRLEDQAWGNVQGAIVTKVQKYVPGVQVKLQDDPQQE